MKYVIKFKRNNSTVEQATTLTFLAITFFVIIRVGTYLDAFPFW